MKTPSESLQGTVQMTLRQVRPLGTTSPVPSHIHEDAPGVCLCSVISSQMRGHYVQFVEVQSDKKG